MDKNAPIDKKMTSTRVLARSAPAIFWLAIWQAASMLDGSGVLLCGPLDTLLALCRLVCAQAFWSSICFSTLRIVAGVVGGYLIAAVLAAASWHARAVRALLQPALLAIKSTPVACVVVILLIWIGAANVSVITVLLLVVPAIYFTVCTGLDNMDAGRRELFEVFGMRGQRRFFALIWPAVLPYQEQHRLGHELESGNRRRAHRRTHRLHWRENLPGKAPARNAGSFCLDVLRDLFVVAV